MESLVECTQCGVLMTSWCATGSPTRYYQCPFCKRTLCSSYHEAFHRGTLGRRVGAAPRPASAGSIPVAEATPEEKSWRELKGRATRWFARLESEGQRRGQPGPELIAFHRASSGTPVQPAHAVASMASRIRKYSP
jgi:hypothetical protein